MKLLPEFTSYWADIDFHALDKLYRAVMGMAPLQSSRELVTELIQKLERDRAITETTCGGIKVTREIDEESPSGYYYVVGVYYGIAVIAPSEVPV